MTHFISSARLSLERIKGIIDNHERLELSRESIAAIEKCRKYLDGKMKDIDRPI